MKTELHVRVTIAMHCNLRPLDVTPVVLRSNHETHNALA